MKRRLYFLFPDQVHARHAVDNLLDGAGVAAHQIHAVAQDELQLERLPGTTRWQKTDAAAQLERRAWNANLGMFGLGLAGFVVALIKRATLGVYGALVVMIATFTGGYLFTQKTPDAHVSEFDTAMAHGEVLIMVDVPRGQVREVGDFMHSRYPEAVIGGASWHVDALGL